MKATMIRLATTPMVRIPLPHVCAVNGLLDDPEELVDRGPALDDLAEPVFLEIDHAVLARLGLDGVDRGVLADHLAHGIGDDQELEDPGAAEVARAAALRADLLRLGRAAVEVLDL